MPVSAVAGRAATGRERGRPAGGPAGEACGDGPVSPGARARRVRDISYRQPGRPRSAGEPLAEAGEVVVELGAGGGVGELAGLAELAAGVGDFQWWQRQAVRAEAVQDMPDLGLGLAGAAGAHGGPGGGGGAAAQGFTRVAGQPVEGVFQPAGDAEVVFGGDDQHRAGGEDGVSEGAYRLREPGCFEVLAEHRDAVQARQVQPKAGRGGIAGGAGEGPVDRGGPQAAD